MSGSVPTVAPPSSERIYGYILELAGNGNDVGRIFGIGQETVIIGRGSHNHIRLNQRIFSRLHATFRIKEKDGALIAELKNESKQRNATIVGSHVLEPEQIVVLESPSLFRLQGHSFKWIENDGSIETIKKSHKAPFIHLTGNHAPKKTEDEESTQDAKAKPIPAVESPSQATPTPSTASPKRRRNSLNISLELRKAAHRRSYRSSVRPVRQSVPLATLAEVVQEETDDEDHRQSSDLILFSPDSPNNTNETSDNVGNYSMITHAATPPFADKSNQTIDEDEEEQEDIGEAMQILLKTPVQKSPTKRISERSTSIIQENIKPPMDIATSPTVASRVSSPAKQFVDASNNNNEVERRRSSRSSVRNSTTAADDTEEFSDIGEAMQSLLKTPVQKSPNKRISERSSSIIQEKLPMGLSTPSASASRVNSPAKQFVGTSKNNIEVERRRSSRLSVRNSTTAADDTEEFSDIGEAMQSLLKTPVQKSPNKRISERSTSTIQENINVPVEVATPPTSASRVNSPAKQFVGARNNHNEVERRRSNRLPIRNSTTAADDTEEFSEIGEAMQSLLKTPVQKYPNKRISERSTSTIPENMNVPVEIATPPTSASIVNSPAKQFVGAEVERRRSSRLPVRNSTTAADDTEEFSDIGEAMQSLLKTPVKKYPNKRISEQSTSIIQENIKSPVEVATPPTSACGVNSPAKQFVGPSNNKNEVERRRSSRLPVRNSTTAADGTKEFSDALVELIHTPVRKSTSKHTSTEMRNASMTKEQKSISEFEQEATPGSSSSTVNDSRKNIELGGRQSFRSSITDSVVAPSSEENVFDGIKNLLQTPVQTTPAKRTGRGKAKDQKMEENDLKSTKEEGPSDSKDKSAKRPRRGKSEDLRVESNATEEPNIEFVTVPSTPGKLTPRNRRGNTQVKAEVRMSVQQRKDHRQSSDSILFNPDSPNNTNDKSDNVGNYSMITHEAAPPIAAKSNQTMDEDEEEKEDIREAMQILLKTPVLKSPNKRISERSTSIIQENINLAVEVTTPPICASIVNSPAKQFVGAEVERRRSSRLPVRNSTTAAVDTEEFSDALVELIHTPVRKSPSRRASTGMRNASTTKEQKSISEFEQETTPGCSDGIKNLFQTPVQRTPAKRTGRGKEKDPKMEENEEKSTKAEGSSVSKDKSAKRPRRGKSEDLRVESNATDEPTIEYESVPSSAPGKLALRSRRGNTQVKAELRMSVQQREDHRQSNDSILFNPDSPNNTNDTSDNVGNYSMITHATTADNSNQTIDEGEEEQEDIGEAMQILLKTPVQKYPNKRISVRSTSIIIQEKLPMGLATPSASVSRVKSPSKQFVDASNNNNEVERRRSTRSSVRNSTTAADDTEEFSDIGEAMQSLLKTPVQKSPNKRISERSTSTIQENINVPVEVATPPTSVSIVNSPAKQFADASNNNNEVERRTNRIMSVRTSTTAADDTEEFSDVLVELIPTPVRKSTSKRASTEMRNASTTKEQKSISEFEQEATPGSSSSTVNDSRKNIELGDRQSFRASIIDSGVAPNSEENIFDGVKNLLQTPVQRTPAKRTGRGKEKDSKMEENDLKSTKEEGPSDSKDKPAKRPRRGKAEDLRVERNATEEPTIEPESVPSSTPGNLAPRIRRGNALVKAEVRMSVQQIEDTPIEGPVKRSRRAKPQAKVEDLQVEANTQVEDEPSNEQRSVSKLPETHARRTRRAKAEEKVEDLQVKNNAEVEKESTNEQESVSASSNKPVKTVNGSRKKKAQESEKEPIGEQVSALAPQEKSTNRPRRGKAQVKVTNPEVESNIEVESRPANEKRSISVSQATPAKRTRRGKGREKVEDLIVEKNTELEEKPTTIEHEQESVSVPRKKPVKSTRRGKAKDITVEETKEDSTRRQEIASAPQEKSSKRPRRGKAQGKVEDLQVETNTEVENESINEQGSVHVSAFSATHPRRTRRTKVQDKVADLQVKNNAEVQEELVNDQESVPMSTMKPVKRTRRGKAEEKIEDLQVNSSTEVEEKSMNDQQNIPESSKKPAKRARRGKAKDLQVEENEEVFTGEQESASTPQEKSTKRPRRIKIKPQSKVTNLQVEDDTEIENERTIEQESLPAIPGTPGKQARRGKVRGKAENLLLKSNTEAEVELKNEQEIVSVPPKIPVKRTRRGQVKNLKVEENEEESTNEEENASVLQDKPAKRTRRGQTKDKDVQTDDNVEAEKPKRTARAKRGNEEIPKNEPTRVMRRRK